MEIVPAERAVEMVAELLRAKPVTPGLSCKVRATDGPGGVGKSALAARVSEALGGLPVVHTDDFASWENQFDWYRRLLDQVLRPLADGGPARYQRFDWERNVLAEWHEVAPSPFLILEGVSASREAFRPYLTASVWIHTDRAERLRRGLHRDGAEALPRWREWMASEDDNIAREQPDRRADLIINGESGRGLARTTPRFDRQVSLHAVRRCTRKAR